MSFTESLAAEYGVPPGPDYLRRLKAHYRTTRGRVARLPPPTRARGPAPAATKRTELPEPPEPPEPPAPPPEAPAIALPAPAAMPDPQKAPGAAVRALLAIVAHEYGMTAAALKIHRRSAALVEARQVAMWFAIELTAASLPRIGRVFGGFDHTTVMHAHRKVTARRIEEPALAARMNALRDRLVADAEAAAGAFMPPPDTTPEEAREPWPGSPEWPPERVAQLRRLIGAALSSREVAAAMGTTPAAVVGKARRLGLTWRGPAYGAARAAQAARQAAG